MRFSRLVSFGLALLLISASLPAQQSPPPQRDPQALAILQVAYPVPLIAAVLNNPDSGYVYLALESLNGLQVHHLQCWNSFNSQPRFQFLAPFTLTDIWIDAASGLPQRISQVQKAGRGSEPR